MLISFALIIGKSVFAADKDAALVLVVNSQNDVEKLSKKEVIDIYMGRFNTFPNGASVMPIDFPQGTNEKQQFYLNLVGKSERKIKAYWSRLLFSGRATPPLEIQPKSVILSTVTKELNSLAYIHKDDVTAEMKIVYQL